MKKRRTIAYVHPEYHGQFVGILDVQIFSHKSSLLLDQQFKYGFLEGLLNSEAIAAISKLDLLKVALSRNKGYVFGVVAGVPFSIANRVGFLAPYVQSVSEYFSYACFGQLCVYYKKTRQGVGTQLLRQLEYRAKRDNFKAIVFPVPKSNVVGRAFLEKRGYSPLLVPNVKEAALYHKVVL